MKKVLIAVLALTMVGGMAFAQTVRWHGLVEGMVGMMSRGDVAGGEPAFGAVAPNSGADGVRFDLTMDAANADGNAGVRLMFRGNAEAGPQAANLLIRQAFGWVRFMDDMIEVRGGRIAEEPHLGNRDGLMNHSFTSPDSIGGVTGVISYIHPIEGLTLGFGAWARNRLHGAVTAGAPAGTSYDAANPELPIHANSAWDNDGLMFYGGFAYTMPDLFRFNAAGWFGHGNTDHAHPNAAVSAYHGNGHAHAGLQIFAIDGIPINTGFSFYNLQDFSDYGIFQGILTVGLNDLVDNLQLGVGGMFAMSQYENHDDPAFGAGIWAAYPIGNIIPRLDLWFFSGTTYSWGNCHAGWGLMRPATLQFDDNFSFIHIRPTVRVAVSPAAWFEVGGIVNIDLGDYNAGGGSAHSNAKRLK
jgi:hypothetical protein